MVRFALALPGLLLLSSCAADLPADHTDRRTPLERAAAEGKINEVRRMLAACSDPNARSETWTSPLEAGAERPHNAEELRKITHRFPRRGSDKDYPGLIQSPAPVALANVGGLAPQVNARRVTHRAAPVPHSGIKGAISA
jgi:hypothetical protein